MAATIYHALGLPPTAAWHDESIARTNLYRGRPSPAWHDGLVPLVPTPVPLVPLL